MKKERKKKYGIINSSSITLRENLAFILARDMILTPINELRQEWLFFIGSLVKKGPFCEPRGPQKSWGSHFFCVSFFLCVCFLDPTYMPVRGSLNHLGPKSVPVKNMQSLKWSFTVRHYLVKTINARALIAKQLVIRHNVICVGDKNFVRKLR